MNSIALLSRLLYYELMIAHLSGTVFAKQNISIILTTGGIGYKVFCTQSVLDSVHTGDELGLYTYHVVREDALDLYGFLTEEEQDLFVLLIGVSGIGPRSALGILNLESIEKLLSAIAHADIAYLTKVSGVGKKSAEKIVLELRDKVEHFDVSALDSSRREEEDVLEALKTLGYRADEAREALRKVPSDITEQGALIKEALKALS